MAKGRQIAAHSGFLPRTKYDLIATLLAGSLAHDYPADEYRIELGARLGQDLNSQVTIFKLENNSAVAFAHLQLDPPAENGPATLERIRDYLRPQ